MRPSLMYQAQEAKNKINDIKKMSMLRKPQAIEMLVDDLSVLLIDIVEEIGELKKCLQNK